MKVLNMVVPILMRFYSLVSNWSFASRIKPHIGVCHPANVTYLIALNYFRQDILTQILTLSNQMSRYKSKCIRMANESPIM